MPYNPAIHNRQSIRLQGYDYSQSGYYFITITTHQKEHLFGEIISGKMNLSSSGEIVHNQWLQLPNRFENIILDAFVIMPNHMHGIILITESNCTGEAGDMRYSPKPKNPLSPASPPPVIGTIPGSIGAIIQNYKSLTTRKINMLLRTKNRTIWHRNYYDHIVRDENDYDRIVEYIQNNPQKWNEDSLYSQ